MSYHFPYVYALISAWIVCLILTFVMDNSDSNNLRVIENNCLSGNVDLNDLLRTFHDDPNNEVRSFMCSPYIEIESLMPVLSKYISNFSVLSLNIQSLNSKFDTLLAILSDLNDNNIKIDAICLQETWLSNDQDASVFSIAGYQLIHLGKKCSSHSGLAIFLSDSFSYLIKSVHDDSALWDGLFIEVSGELLCDKIIIGNIYRPPRLNNNNKTIKEFCEELTPVISDISKNNCHIIIAGDFNIDLLQINERSEFQKYFDLFVTHGLFPNITVPTRCCKSSSSLIDQMFCKLKEPQQHVTSCVIKSCISDHFPYLSILDILKTQRHTPKYVKINRTDEISFEAFHSEVKSRIESFDMDLDLFSDPNENYRQFEEIILHAKSKHLSPKTVRFKKHKHKLSKWMTNGILNSIKFRDKLFLKLKKLNPGSELHDHISSNLKSYNKILKKLIRQAKIQYYSDQFDKNKSNIRHTWSTIKEILNKCKDKKEFPAFFTINDEHVTDKTDISNNFNSFFANIGTNLSNNIKFSGNKTISSYLKQKVISSFEFECVTSTEVTKIIKNLASKNSSGHDGISARFIKRMLDTITPSLTHIINQSLSTGIFPDRLKIAKVIPLFKKGDEHILDNYRPISLLPAISKVFEKIVFNQLYQYFTDNDLIFTSQYGFRKLHSTEFASIELVDRISQYMDSGKLPLSIFLDLSKAFDTLDHSILLSKLKFYGVSNTPLKWFQSYLQNRQQFVEFDGTCSDTTFLNTGVPQGSILGPLLFLIYMNDIHTASNKFDMILYADDTNLISPLCSFNSSLSCNKSEVEHMSQQINTELRNIQEWLNINKLSLNVSKTKYMIFHHYQRNITNIIPTLKINFEPIERVMEFNFLGLTIDEHLSWKPHIQKISNKIARTLGIMCRLKNFLPTHVLRILYNSMILPHLQYSILSWGFKPGRLDKLQKRAVRIISNSKYNSHTDPIFKKLNLLKLKDLFELNVLKLFYKYKNNILPFYVSHMFSDYSVPHSYPLRATYVLNAPGSNTPSGEKCIRHYLPSVVDKLKPDILDKVSTHSLQGYAFYIKRITITEYKMECVKRNCYVCDNHS